MSEHHVRDLRFTTEAAYVANGNHAKANQVLFHMLMTAGWSKIWECDGGVGPNGVNPNHVSDGNMSSGDTSSYTSVSSGVLSKETSIVKSGSKSLKVAATGSGDGVSTIALLTMTPPVIGTTGTGDSVAKVNDEVTLTDAGTLGADYAMLSGGRIVCSGDAAGGNNGTFTISRKPYSTGHDYISFYNPNGVDKLYVAGSDTMDYSIQYRYQLLMWVRAGAAWTIEVDPGTGSWSSIGTIADTSGSWVLKDLPFYVQGSGDVKIRITKDSAGADNLYVDGMNVCWPFFSGACWASGTDGILTNPDLFSVGVGDSYTPGNFDVGHVLFVFDPTNPENSGAYEIIAHTGGGTLQVNLQSSNVDFTTVSGGGLSWRIVDIQEHAYNDIPDEADSVGFGIESPHTTSWRFFLRQDTQDGQTTKCSQYWAAPEDTDFDFSSGYFFSTGPSSQNQRCTTWTRRSGQSTVPDMHVWRGPYEYIGSTFTTKTFMKFGGDGEFFALLHGKTDLDDAGYFVVGYLSAVDSYHTLQETWGIHGPWYDIGSATISLGSTASNYNFGYSNTVIDDVGKALEAGCVQFGFGNTTGCVETDSDAKATPYGDSNEWMRPLLIMRDFGSLVGKPSIREASVGLKQGRANLTTLSVFDSDTKLHLYGGFIWDNWNGGQLLP